MANVVGERRWFLKGGVSQQHDHRIAIVDFSFFNDIFMFVPPKNKRSWQSPNIDFCLSAGRKILYFCVIRKSNFVFQNYIKAGVET